MNVPESRALTNHENVVVPAEAGTQTAWIPVFTGMTNKNGSPLSENSGRRMDCYTITLTGRQ